jgi:hypothetical protein
MLRKMLHWGSREIEMTASNENAPGIASDRLPQADDVRALATGAALAASIDSSPAVLVNLYDYAHRYGDGRRRRTA